MPSVVLPPAAVSPPRGLVVDREEANADWYDADAWLAAADTIMERHDLPDPPQRHRSALWWNHFKPDACVNPARAYPLKKLIDRWGTPPPVAYLVEWDVKPSQLSWEWPENLRGVDYLMNQVNRGRRLMIRVISMRITGTISVELLLRRLACASSSLLKRPVPTSAIRISSMVVTGTEYGKDLSNAVVRADVVAFFRVLAPPAG
ncbi:hypothetical protein DVH05_000447 [Phytophthora capsici]|nr:hypothetical protein DVH05_000447 [Phytophthora capsici]